MKDITLAPLAIMCAETDAIPFLRHEFAQLRYHDGVPNNRSHHGR